MKSIGHSELSVILYVVPVKINFGSLIITIQFNCVVLLSYESHTYFINIYQTKFVRGNRK